MEENITLTQEKPLNEEELKKTQDLEKEKHKKHNVIAMKKVNRFIALVVIGIIIFLMLVISLIIWIIIKVVK